MSENTIKAGIRAIIGLCFLLIILISGCSSSDGDPSAYPGKLARFELLKEYSAQQVAEVIKVGFSETGEDLSDLINTSTAVKAYIIEYYIINIDGGMIVASGLVAVPNPATAEYPAVSYLHGTMFNNQDVPSNPDRPHSQEALPTVALFAGHGYVAVLPDYIGQGRGTKVPHPYLHADSMATSTADMLTAARELCTQLSIKMNSRLFICGLSEGGHATLALQRYLETSTAPQPFHLTASAPFAGPYSLPKAWEFWQTNPPGVSPLAVHLILSYKAIYGFKDSLSEIFKPPYDTTNEKIDDGTHDGEEMYDMLPKKLQELLQEAFLGRVNAKTHPFYDEMEENSVYDFAPKTPTRLHHAINDELLPYSMSIFTRDHMISLGAKNVEVVIVGPQWSHVSSFLPCMLSAKRYFDTF
ncbi:MAG: hypothetical protein HQK58_10250 [Deltaproteobacteria bacterium]|nr:hypothetical protein [Deltaproteobacteria bacterium]